MNFWLADLYLFASFVCRLFGFKTRSRSLGQRGKALQERCQIELQKRLEARLHKQRELDAKIYEARRKREAQEEKKRQQREEAERLRKQWFFDDPERNTRDWKLHQERLRRCGASRYEDCSYYVGPRGGVYYINYRGRKTYC